MKDSNRDDALDPLLRQAAKSLDGERPSSACFEPDELAAWADGSLSSSDVTRLEAHAAACARCRALMVAMVQTAPAADESRPAWWKAPVLRWAAPLAAAAAATVIWVNVQRGDPLEQQAPADAAPRVEEQDRSVREPVPPPTAKADATAKQQAAAAPPDAPARRESFEAKREETRQQVAAKPDAVPPGTVPPPSAQAAQERVFDQTARPTLSAIQQVLLASPDGSVRWRVRPGVAERSTDAGASWEAVALPVQVPLTVGQCVTAEACWLAGAAGTILRTTDGRTWTAVTSPSPADIRSLSASSPLDATVTTSDGRTFVTTDGGKTWR